MRIVLPLLLTSFACVARTALPTDTDRASPLASVGFSSLSIAALESTPTVRLTITRTAVSDRDLGLRITDAGFGTATPMADYVPVAGDVVISAGATQAGFDVALIDDALAEPSETIAISLALVDDDAATLDTNAATFLLAIDDNDGGAVVTLRGADFAWDARYEPVHPELTVQRSGSATTTDTDNHLQPIAPNLPRFARSGEGDPCGLLVEPASANIIADDPEELTSVYNVDIQRQVALAPGSTYTLDVFTANQSGALNHVYDSTATLDGSGSWDDSYAMSAYLAGDPVSTHRALRMSIDAGAGRLAIGNFDLAAMTAGADGWAGVSWTTPPFIARDADGLTWLGMAARVVPGDTGGAPRIALTFVSEDGAFDPYYSVGSGSVGVGPVQIERADAPTRFIPRPAGVASSSRTADVPVFQGVAALSAPRGTLVMSVRPDLPPSATPVTLLTATGGTSSLEVALSDSAVSASTTPMATIDVAAEATPVARDWTVIAVSYGDGTLSLAVDGGAVVSQAIDTAGSFDELMLAGAGSVYAGTFGFIAFYDEVFTDNALRFLSVPLRVVGTDSSGSRIVAVTDAPRVAWQPHPLATGYRVFVHDAAGGIICGPQQAPAAASELVVSSCNLMPGRYMYRVEAMRTLPSNVALTRSSVNMTMVATAP